MDMQMVREHVAIQARARGLTLREAANEVIRGLGLSVDVVERALEELLQEAQRNQILDDPRGVALKEAQHAAWYTGPTLGDKYWPSYLSASGLEEKPGILAELDKSSTKIVSQLADPGIRGLKKKGLVVGYVQSGKTANYSAVIAKAADAGYRLVIVLSGIHNNLRKQTQVRLNHDLAVAENWDPLTDEDADFGNAPSGAARMASRLRMLAVVKKNSSRLERLRDWLRAIPEDGRLSCPILLIDDEADQATPNTMAASEEMSRINELVREIWGEIKTGTYIGYTATPFANVFMDPNDESEMYPSDFIVDLPRPNEYFGAERIFGSPILDSGADEVSSLDVARVIPDSDAEGMIAPSKSEQRIDWEPSISQSFVEAVRWFLLATAARRARDGVEKHSSMLVHTTPFVLPHEKLKKATDELLSQLIGELESGDLSDFQRLWEAEYPRVEPVNQAPIEWSDVLLNLEDVARSARIVVDNGISEDRLDYGRTDAHGNELIETVIAIGGSTLSRGLTLEGLVVSYFTRAARTYDTLLQMGRWFGYRVGYEELPRIWLTESILENFRFLAQVEWEVREEMYKMEARGVSPYQYGLQVRSHPGNLMITSANKMHHVEQIRVTFSGQRHQTILFDEHERSVQLANIDATHRLLESCVQSARSERVGNASVFHDVPAREVIDFLARFNFYPGTTLDGAQAVDWLNRFAPDRPWNVAVVSRANDAAGKVDLGVLGDVNGLIRAPLREPTDFANIKALMTKGDTVLDLGVDAVNRVNKKEKEYSQLRVAAGDLNGLLVVYPIAKGSKPTAKSELTKSRRALRSPMDLIGLGIVFPYVLDGDVLEDGTFLAVKPNWVEEVFDTAEDERIRDTESDYRARDLSREELESELRQ